jgi:hypothetical protein
MVTEWWQLFAEQNHASVQVIAFPAHASAFPFCCMQLRLEQNPLHLPGFFDSFL